MCYLYFHARRKLKTVYLIMIWFSLPILIEIKLLHFRFNANSGSDAIVQVVATEWNIKLILSYSSDDAAGRSFLLHDSVTVHDEVRGAAPFSSTLVQSCVEDVVGGRLGDLTGRI